MDTDPISEAARKAEIELTCKYIREPIQTRTSTIINDTGSVSVSVVHREDDGTYHVTAILHTSHSIIVSTSRTITEWDLASNTITKHDWTRFISGMARDIAAQLSREGRIQADNFERKRHLAAIRLASTDFNNSMEKTSTAMKEFAKVLNTPPPKQFRRSRRG